MKHSIPVDKLGPAGSLMSEAIQSCVHCGFCLPTCPTYSELAQEMDSPRGRIILMKEALEGKLPTEQVLPYIDRCLGCLACETSCPSGVEYRNLLGPFREKAETESKRSVAEKLKRKALLTILPWPGRFRIAAKVGMLARPFGRLLPDLVRSMLALLPKTLPSGIMLPEVAKPMGTPRARVALLVGCAQQVMDPQINDDTIAVLVRNGVEVLIPRGQTCCGALGWHVGAGEHARRFARKNLEAFPRDVDAILTNAAGCGSGLKEYPLILKGSAEESASKSFAGKVVDFGEFLDQLGMVTPPRTKGVPRVVYQDACHLRHAQGVTEAPRRLLRAIPGLELLEAEEPDICCGSAGSYNIDQPKIAADLGKRKVSNLLKTKPDWIVSGNIGCIMQVRSCMNGSGQTHQVVHLAGLLRRAYEEDL